MEMFEVVLDDKAGENGLATMLYQMIKENIEKNPWKEGDAKSIKSDIFIYARDADVRVSMSFKQDRVIVFDGELFSPDIKIEANTADLIEMSKIKLIGPIHIPIFDKETFPVLVKILKGDVKINLKIKKAKALFHLIRLLSVYP